MGAKDQEIRVYARQTRHILVTRDFANCCRCLEENINTAFYFNGNACVLKVEKVLPLGEEKKTDGAPIKKLFRLNDRQEWVSMMYRQYVEQLKAAGICTKVASPSAMSLGTKETIDRP